MHKVIVHKANEDCIISIDELVVVLSILLEMEAAALVTLLRRLPILLLVLNLNVLVLLLTSALDIPLGGANSRSKKRLKLRRACAKGSPILLLVLVPDLE